MGKAPFTTVSNRPVRFEYTLIGALSASISEGRPSSWAVFHRVPVWLSQRSTDLSREPVAFGGEKSFEGVSTFLIRMRIDPMKAPFASGICWHGRKLNRRDCDCWGASLCLLAVNRCRRQVHSSLSYLPKRLLEKEFNFRCLICRPIPSRNSDQKHAAYSGQKSLNRLRRIVAVDLDWCGDNGIRASRGLYLSGESARRI